jgi:virginiamycin B lyase
MSARSPLAVVCLVAGLAVSAPAQPPTPTPTPRPAPPLHIAFSSLVPDAKFEVGGVRDFAATDDAFWILDRSSGALTRFDPKTNKSVATVAVGKGGCIGLAADFGSILLPQCATKTIVRVDSKTNAIGEPLPAPLSPTARSVATGVGSVWTIADPKGTLARIDPVEKAVVALIDLPSSTSSLAYGADALWVASAAANTVTRVNPYNNVIVETIAVSGGPRDLAIGGGSVWTLNAADGSVTRIDAKTNSITTTIKIAASPGTDARIAFGEGSVWVASTGTPLVRIDPRTNQVVQIFAGVGYAALSIAHGSLWMAASPTAVWRLDPKRIEATR